MASLTLYTVSLESANTFQGFSLSKAITFRPKNRLLAGEAKRVEPLFSWSLMAVTSITCFWGREWERGRGRWVDRWSPWVHGYRAGESPGPVDGGGESAAAVQHDLVHHRPAPSPRERVSLLSRTQPFSAGVPAPPRRGTVIWQYSNAITQHNTTLLQGFPEKRLHFGYVVSSFTSQYDNRKETSVHI